MDGISSLREAIATVPVPGAPPRLSRDGAVVGLAFLDSALRLNHVRRLTERLSLVEHRIARRTTEVDISLNMLDAGQRAAAMLFQQLVSHSLADANQEVSRDHTMWVPIARILRRTAEPIDVRDSSGQKVPRLTQYETSRLMVSGLYRLLREILATHPDASTRDTDLNRILSKNHESRWLIQAALLTLFTERSRPDAHTSMKQTPQTVAGHGAQYRKLASNVLGRYESYLRDYLALLDIALNEHLLVVALDSRIDEHLLTYDSPLYVNQRATFVQRLRRTLRASVEGYYVQYNTSIPSTLRSYHLVFESGPNVDLSHMYLSTDADARAVRSVELDLAEIANRLESEAQSPVGEPGRKILELETQTVLRRLAEVVRRRRWEASHVRIALPQRYLSASFKLTQAVVSGEAIRVNASAIDNSILEHPNVSPETLRDASKELDSMQMLYDLSLEKEPTSNRAHAYWRRAPERSVNASQIRITAGAILRDATGAGPRDAILYALALAGMTYLVACFLNRSLFPYWDPIQNPFGVIHSPEAVIGVLLVVPGFLYTRLTLPDPHSISGHLRAVPRIAVRICILSMVVAAASVAAGSSGWVIRIAFIVGTLVPIASILLLFRTRSYDLTDSLGRMGAPKWAVADRSDKFTAVAPDVRFSSSESRHE